jgi:hypothetical protein
MSEEIKVPNVEGFLENVAKVAAYHGMGGVLLSVLVPDPENAQRALVKTSALGLGGYGIEDTELILKMIGDSQKKMVKTLKKQALNNKTGG